MTPDAKTGHLQIYLKWEGLSYSQARLLAAVVYACKHSSKKIKTLKATHKSKEEWCLLASVEEPNRRKALAALVAKKFLIKGYTDSGKMLLAPTPKALPNKGDPFVVNYPHWACLRFSEAKVLGVIVPLWRASKKSYYGVKAVTRSPEVWGKLAGVPLRTYYNAVVNLSKMGWITPLKSRESVSQLGGSKAWFYVTTKGLNGPQTETPSVTGRVATCDRKGSYLCQEEQLPVTGRVARCDRKGSSLKEEEIIEEIIEEIEEEGGPRKTSANLFFLGELQEEEREQDKSISRGLENRGASTPVVLESSLRENCRAFVNTIEGENVSILPNKTRVSAKQVWNRLHVGMHYDMAQPLNGRECKLLKDLLSSVPGGRGVAALKKVFVNYAQFCAYAKEKQGAFGWGENPTIQFLYKHRGAVATYYASSLTPDPVVKNSLYLSASDFLGTGETEEKSWEDSALDDLAAPEPGRPVGVAVEVKPADVKATAEKKLDPSQAYSFMGTPVPTTLYKMAAELCDPDNPQDTVDYLNELRQEALVARRKLAAGKAGCLDLEIAQALSQWEDDCKLRGVDPDAEFEPVTDCIAGK